MKEMPIRYAKKINQHKFKYQTMFSARFDKQDEDGQILDEIEFFCYLKFHRNVTVSDFDNFDVRSQLEQQIQNQKSKDSGWSFDKINPMTIYFSKRIEIYGSYYAKLPLNLQLY